MGVYNHASRDVRDLLISQQCIVLTCLFNKGLYTNINCELFVFSSTFADLQ